MLTLVVVYVWFGYWYKFVFFFFQAEDGIRDIGVTGVQTCALPIYGRPDGGGEDGGQPVLALDADVEQAHPEGDRDGQPREEQRHRPVEDHDDRLHLLRGAVAQVHHHPERLERVLPDERDDHRGDDQRDQDREDRAESGR